MYLIWTKAEVRSTRARSANLKRANGREGKDVFRIQTARVSGWRCWRKFETWREGRIIELWARRVGGGEEWNATWANGTFKIYRMSRVNFGWGKAKFANLIFYFSHYHFEHKFGVLLPLVSFLLWRRWQRVISTAPPKHSLHPTSQLFDIFLTFAGGSFVKWADRILLLVSLSKAGRFLFHSRSCRLLSLLCKHNICIVIFMARFTHNFFSHLLFIYFDTRRALLWLILSPSLAWGEFVPRVTAPTITTTRSKLKTISHFTYMKLNLHQKMLCSANPWIFLD